MEGLFISFISTAFIPALFVNLLVFGVKNFTSPMRPKWLLPTACAVFASIIACVNYAVSADITAKDALNQAYGIICAACIFYSAGGFDLVLKYALRLFHVGQN